jgi:hypothetical protein
MIKVYLENNAIQVRDIEEVDKMCHKNKEERARKRLP